MHRSGSFLTRDAKSSRTIVGIVAVLTIWRAILVRGRHARHNVYDLKSGLFAGQNSFLACNQDHWHGAEKGVRSASRKVQSPRA